MGRWCDRISTAHEVTVARCQSLERELSLAQEEVERLRLEAMNAQVGSGSVH